MECEQPPPTAMPPPNPQLSPATPEAAGTQEASLCPATSVKENATAPAGEEGACGGEALGKKARRARSCRSRGARRASQRFNFMSFSAADPYKSLKHPNKIHLVPISRRGERPLAGSRPKTSQAPTRLSRRYNKMYFAKSRERGAPTTVNQSLKLTDNVSPQKKQPETYSDASKRTNCFHFSRDPLRTLRPTTAAGVRSEPVNRERKSQRVKLPSLEAKKRRNVFRFSSDPYKNLRCVMPLGPSIDTAGQNRNATRHGLVNAMHFARRRGSLLAA